MGFRVLKANNPDVEREHLNKILSKIEESLSSLALQQAITFSPTPSSDTGGGGTTGGGGSGATWGSITGVLSSQTDLQSALDGKAPTVHQHAPSDFTGFGADGGYLRSSGTAWLRTQGVAWNDLTGVPATFPPNAHTHSASEIVSGTFLLARIPGLPAVQTTSGVFSTARLGTGTPSSAVWLRGDGAWAALPAPPAPVWGTITGTLAAQTDLQTALNGKAPVAHTHPLANLQQSGATTGQVPTWNGSAWAPATVSGGGGVTWSTTTVNSNLSPGLAVIANSATTLNLTLPITITTGDEFIAHARQASHRVVSNGNTIDAVGSGNDLLVEDGNTAHLVAYANGLLRIV